jgi:AbrB family looped-hinge helix DNA binding protein
VLSDILEGMNSVTKVGKRGEVPLPEGVREEARLKEGDLLFVETNPDGSITLRPAPPVREYTEEDLAMFAEEDEMTPAERDRFLRWLGREPRLFGR